MKYITTYARFNQKKLLLLALLALNGCAAALIGSAASVGAAATREKGLSGAMNDSQISVRIKANLYAISPDLHAALGVNVQQAEVLLTGAVPTQELQVKAVKACWDVPGVKRVLDNTQVSQGAGLSGFAKDTWISTQVKSKIFFAQDIRSLNYSIKTVGCVVYIMGLAQSEKELNLVIQNAKTVDGVTRVINYAKVKEGAEKDAGQEDEKDAAEDTSTKDSSTDDDTDDYPATD